MRRSASILIRPERFAADPEAAARLLGERLDSVPDVRAVGEIGLDYHYDFSPREVQQAVFRAQLQVARDRQLPVVIHTREAEADTLGILGEGGRVETTGVFHCFSGDAAAAARALATGYYLRYPESCRFRARRSCAKRSERSPAIACWSKPTAPTLRRLRSAASGTSRHTSSAWGT